MLEADLGTIGSVELPVPVVLGLVGEIESDRVNAETRIQPAVEIHRVTAKGASCGS